MEVSESELTAVHVNLKAPVAPSHITTNDPVEICYGSEAVMTAYADIDYPQMVTWYDADRLIPMRQQPINSGKDTLTETPTESGVYYVYITNEANCPLPGTSYTSEREVVMSGSYDYYEFAPYERLVFYDEGGLDQNYSTTCTTHTYNFSSPSASYLQIHFNNVDLGENSNSSITLSIRNREGNQETVTISGILSNRDIPVPCPWAALLRRAAFRSSTRCRPRPLLRAPGSRCHPALSGCSLPGTCRTWGSRV